MKRWRKPTAKTGELKVAFGKYEGELDIFYCYPENESGMSRDSRMLSAFFEWLKGYDGLTLRQELERRGYDITTLKFSVMKANPERA